MPVMKHIVAVGCVLVRAAFSQWPRALTSAPPQTRPGFGCSTRARAALGAASFGELRLVLPGGDCAAVLQQ